MLNIEEWQVTVEPTKALEEISLDKTTWDGSLVSTHKPTFGLQGAHPLLKEQPKRLYLEPWGHAGNWSKYHGSSTQRLSILPSHAVEKESLYPRKR